MFILNFIDVYPIEEPEVMSYLDVSAMVFISVLVIITYFQLKKRNRRVDAINEMEPLESENVDLFKELDILMQPKRDIKM